VARWSKVLPICCHPFRLAKPQQPHYYSVVKRPYTEGFSHFSMTAPINSGWNGCRVEPTE
jgi:hypothetical protein